MRVRPYIWYAERTKMCHDAVDRNFYDAIIIEEEIQRMAVKIRLTRLGRKKVPFYRIIVADIESKRDGKFLDILGTYDPLKDPAEVKIDDGKLQAWLAKGAKPTTTVRSLIAKCNAASTEATE